MLQDGRIYEQSCAAFTDENDHTKMIIVLRDVTEKKKMQTETMRASHLAAVGELAAGVAHEINNPINGIINYAQILADDCEEGGRDAEIPNRIIKEGERIAGLVRNLLSFARDRKEEHSPMRLQDVLSDALALTHTQMRKDSIKLKLDVPDDLPKIKGRSQEIQQVFLNILSNARHALNQKFPGVNEKKRLEIEGELTDIKGRRYVRMTFHDAGVGMPEHVLGRICDPFFSTKPKNEGTGLGLSISYGIVKDHGGRLWFDSLEGAYTKAVVDLPIDNI
jgi:signal transduction histidine kinase